MFRLRFLNNRRAYHGQANLFVLFNRGEREMKFKKLLAKKKTGISWVVILKLFNHGQREFKFKK
jgi:hypothetical protein